ncbi:MAG TPA: hypothetical protein VK136_05100 [Bacillota bacterium]|nr:hypothetical protein [Bacillota bacterium]
MHKSFHRPKTFGEILDHTFRLCKDRFKDFFLIMLIVIGPVYLLEVFLQMMTGTSFFRDMGTSGPFLDNIDSFIEENADTTIENELGTLVTNLIVLILLPIAYAAVLLAFHRLKNNETFSAGEVIKQAFSKFWSILGASVIFGLILFALIFVPIFILTILVIISIATTHPAVAIILAIVLFLGVLLAILPLSTRWSFYLGAVVFENKIPGLASSWRLSSGRTWWLVGIFIVFNLIAWIIGSIIEGVFSLVLGYSVLFAIISDIVALFTSMIIAVGYAVVYFDLRTRKEADDLRAMIDDYNSPTN